MEHILWVERHRPKTIEQTILPDRLKSTFQEFVNKKEIPNLLLSGGAGTGKTTVARAMLEEIGADYIIINGSMNGDIDTLRNEIQTYASTISFTSNRKYVILDEADYLTSKVMASLRGFIEEFSSNCGFILTCNFKNRIIEPIHSRCSCIDFTYTKDEIKSLSSKFFKRVTEILDIENIVYDKKVVAELIVRYYPDGRRIINELQRYSATGTIDSGILSLIKGSHLNDLIPLMKNKDFSSVRKWIGENSDIPTTEFYRAFYDNCNKYFSSKSIPYLVVILAKYQYQEAFVVDKEINLSAALVAIMAECEFE